MAPSFLDPKKFCTVAGFILAEVYMLPTVLGPNLDGGKVPFIDQAERVGGAAIFFGPLGAAVGMGVGLLVAGLMDQFRRKE